jgi:hypothetical protein
MRQFPILTLIEHMSLPVTLIVNERLMSYHFDASTRRGQDPLLSSLDHPRIWDQLSPRVVRSYLLLREHGELSKRRLNRPRHLSLETQCWFYLW